MRSIKRGDIRSLFNGVQVALEGYSVVLSDDIATILMEKGLCEACGSEDIVRSGKNRAGSQRYNCKASGVTRVLESDQASCRLDMDFGGQPRDDWKLVEKIQSLANFKDALLRAEPHDV